MHMHDTFGGVSTDRADIVSTSCKVCMFIVLLYCRDVVHAIYYKGLSYANHTIISLQAGLIGQWHYLSHNTACSISSEQLLSTIYAYYISIPYTQDQRRDNLVGWFCGEC